MYSRDEVFLCSLECYIAVNFDKPLNSPLVCAETIRRLITFIILYLPEWSAPSTVIEWKTYFNENKLLPRVDCIVMISFYTQITRWNQNTSEPRFNSVGYKYILSSTGRADNEYRSM